MNALTDRLTAMVILPTLLAGATVAKAQEVPAPPAAPTASPDEKPTTAKPVETPAPESAPLPIVPSKEPEPGDEVEVEYRDGRMLVGRFVGEDDLFVTIEISAVEVRIPRQDLESVLALGTPLERYERMRPAIPNDDARRLITLARWLQTNRLFELGLREVELALEADPTSDEAWRLHRELVSQVEMTDRTGDGEPAVPQDVRKARTKEQRSELLKKIRASSDFQFLSESEINLIKVYELNLNHSPRIRIDRSTVERFLSEYSDHPLVPTTRDGRKAFLRKSPEEVLDTMFRVRARDLYGEVTVIDDPKSMDLFRQRVQATWLVNNCATSRCHGGPGVGGLWLANQRRRSDEAAYTNMLILDRTTLADGTPLIDYERPDNSPLIQLGLPADDSARPHPQVIGWRPAFRSRRSRGYVYTLDWLKSMYKPRPEYPIDYTPPGLTATTPAQEFEPVEK